MIKQKAIVLLKKIVFSVFASACVFSCKNFESDLGSFFESYGNVASVKSVTYSRPLYTGDGSYAIDSDSDFTVSYIIDNPGKFPLIVATNSSHTKLESNYLITRSYTAAELAALELGGGKITTSFSLIGIAPNGKYIPQSSYYGPDILCNSPPPAINNAMGQMQNDPASSINERLVVCVQLPLLKGALDWKSFVVTDKRTETVHSYDFAKIDGSRTNAIQNGTESNGWTIYNSANPPSMMWPTYSGGPTFSWMTGEGAVYYIVTDVNNLSSVEPFQITLTLKDDSGLTNPIEIPSHAVKLAPPTCNINVASVSNTLDQAYVEFIIHAPANASDATLHYAIADSSGNPVADTSGSATEHVGDATFRLYPKLDGSAENYTISQAYATKTGWMDSDDAAATFGGGGTISVTGVQLGAPTCNLVDGQTYPQETELVITSPEAADVGWIYNINSGAFITGSAPSPASIRLEEAGAYAFAYYTQKDYYEKSATVNLSFDVSLTALYVASYGLDTNAGTRTSPFGTIQHAIDTFAAGSSPSSPDNSVYILDDMTSINGLTSMGSGYVNIVGCNGGESGVPGTPVALFCAHDKTVIQLSGGTMSLRAVSITGISGTSNGAVYVSGGTFILKDKVTITGNKKDDASAMNVNIGSGVITVDANGISGTKVGVTSASAPSLGSPVEITSGYGASVSATDNPALHFVSDNAIYGIGLNAAGTEAALVTGGGSIDIGDIASVSFAAAGSAGVYTVKATATPTSGSPLDITSEVTAWTLKLYYLNTYTGMTSVTNTMDLSALGEGTYIMKISAVYGGKTYSGEVEIVKGPAGLSTPLTLEAAVAGAVVTFDNKASGPVTYRVNGGTEQTIASAATGTITLAAVGDKVQFYGDNAAYATDTTDGNSSNIACNKNCYVYGNIMSLIKSAGFESQKTLTGNYTFCKLFKGNAYIKNKTGTDLLLPATTLKDCCYQAMFQNCASLTTVPELPATSVTYHGYYSMFQGCTSLTTAPNLPATSLAMASCCRMFQDCTSLTSAPALPATTMKSNCYESMFQGCTSLASAPELPATTLQYACYAHMFEGCTSLTSAPELPATTLESTCYAHMFEGCTSLTSAPELPATTLAESCYSSMFNGCSSLNSVTCLATDISASNCTSNWLKDIASSGTFTQAAGVDWSGKTGFDGIPSGWTVQTAP